MGKLSNIDAKAQEKGSGLMTLWQFVKFIFVSLLAMIVQFAILNILSHVPSVIEMGQEAFNWFVFSYPVESEGLGGLGYFIAFNTANIIAQIVAFFVNREKTFNANNNIPVTLTIYIIFTIALICFSAWLSPTLNGLLLEKGASEVLALNAATMACSAIQFFLYFPVDKLLMRQKKTDTETTTEA